ncbi:MAG: hypothetical protein D4R65_05615 [Verrucomicrobiaceae bacterium]|nr:MAG: hypothetical protein D4R65_05615 [Verrucomicrobiaceae bacterium]
MFKKRKAEVLTGKQTTKTQRKANEASPPRKMTFSKTSFGSLRVLVTLWCDSYPGGATRSGERESKTGNRREKNPARSAALGRLRPHFPHYSASLRLPSLGQTFDLVPLHKALPRWFSEIRIPHSAESILSTENSCW